MAENFPLQKPLVHIIDREADSAPHLRQLMGVKWLTRGKKNTSVKYNDRFISLEKMTHKINSEVKSVINFKGKEAYLLVVEAEVVLQIKPERGLINSPTVRFVSTICNEEGEHLAQWLLISNVPDVDALILATTGAGR
jgi:hypothetical protein